MVTYHPRMAQARMNPFGSPGVSPLTIHIMALPRGDTVIIVPGNGGPGQDTITTVLTQVTLHLLTFQTIQSMPTETEAISMDVKSMPTGKTDRLVACQSGDARTANLTWLRNHFTPPVVTIAAGLRAFR